MPARPTLHPHSPFNAQSDADGLYKSMKGLGTDEKQLTSILTARVWKQRQEISRAYQEKYRKSLLADVKSDTSGDYYRLLKALIQSPEVSDAKDLNYAMKGIGTDEDLLMEILFTRTNSELHNIDKAYLELFKVPLSTAIKNDTSGDFRNLLLAIAAGKRDANSTSYNPNQAIDDGKALYDAGPNRLGTNMAKFTEIFSQRSMDHLWKVFHEFKMIAKMDILDAIKSEMSGDAAKAFRTLAYIILNAEEYFAFRLAEALKRPVKDRTVIRVIVSRSENDLANIKDQFRKVAHKSLETCIEDETSSDYKTALLDLVGRRK
ncbi:annexin A2-like [Paramacrobiotus metropolitanus]|uniref:annexin A2-like n=1 Tax=Paramacrobiotus metropolitanus TaxID=2943436 RepID=UPI002445628A|nr:annexin A2-like [Paramacrobiotus metropolitanus]XP_055330877.1 annexin A2-like [Paramacrobiotus metropolitanus]XP_055330878.1 annexin A2-like [Paramacrobiotus metropolitanus]